MLHIKPFSALRPRPDLCQQVASVPYDVVDRREASALARDNPLSFLHVSRSEIDLPEATDPYSPEVYRAAAARFAGMQKDGTLVRDKRPSLYVYRLKRQSRCQHGIVACCSAADYENNIIKKHEKTRVDKEEDRKKHTAALRAHSGPVFLIFRDQPDINLLTREAELQQPLYDFTAPDGVGHTVWPVSAPSAMINAFRQVPAAYIADGHHRAAAGVRVAGELARREGQNPDAEFNFFLAVLFPASQLEILPYNRCVLNLGTLSAPERFLAEINKRFKVTGNAPPNPARAGTMSMYFDKRWFCLEPARAAGKDPVAGLDVSILQSELFEPILGIKDPRTDKRLEFIGGIHGTQELESRVSSGRAAVAFSMYPVSVSQLLAISDAGQCMPPKSTWFEPKLRDALLIHTF